MSLLSSREPKVIFFMYKILIKYLDGIRLIEYEKELILDIL